MLMRYYLGIATLLISFLASAQEEASCSKFFENNPVHAQTCLKAPGKKLYAKDFSSLGLEYSNELIYLSPREHYHTPAELLPEHTVKLAERYQDLIANHYEAPWSLRYIDEKIGYGVFAEADIEEGQLIGEYTGYVISNELAYFMYSTDFVWQVDLFAQIYPGNYVCIDALKVCNFTRFVNHSYDPNILALNIYCQDQWHLVYVAGKSIKKDQQLLVDYGQNYWKSRYEPTVLE